jgi:hypothetical protein
MPLILLYLCVVMCIWDMYASNIEQHKTITILEAYISQIHITTQNYDNIRGIHNPNTHNNTKV